MSNSGKILQGMRTARGLNQKDVANALGIEQETVSRIERKGSPKRGNTVRLMMEYYEKIPVLPFEEAVDLNVEPLSERKMQEIPTYDLGVAAGGWAEVFESGPEESERTIEYGIFRIKIRGDSMEKEWPDGSVVEFRHMRWRGMIGEGEEFIVGKDYYVQVHEMATFKRLEAVDDVAFTLTFRAINNKKYPKPMIVQWGDIQRIARAEALVILR